MAEYFLLEKVQQLYGDKQASKLHCVQTLWSGYGEIARYVLPASQRSCIVKQINLLANASHPRGWNTDFSHQRKLASYLNEQRFYESLAINCNEYCKVPKTYACGASNDVIWLIMEDLDASGFEQRHATADLSIAKRCVSWLAHFHATFLATDISAAWPVGTYWFLATRPDEWQQMPASRLKGAASLIDRRLNSARYQTLLHGDAKLANFCFAEHTDQVAAVDFQYTGKGSGIKDLVYLMGSCFADAQLRAHMPLLVDEYFATLKQSAPASLSTAQMSSLEKEWRDLLPFAWADFERFLHGWSPGHQKLSRYSQVQTEIALAKL